MVFSAVLMGIVGISLSFLPQELAEVIFNQSEGWAVLVLQILGAQYVAFGMINWMAKDNLIGGIYSKPVAMGNFLHFAISSLALVKAAAVQHTGYWIVTAIYVILACIFGYVFFTHPTKNASKS
ncbi:hypothetical protein C900_05841 [Fulvivirga imtechensis AK7]|uniref:Uncharacterized protein n=2 Tax=Fulvivirga TaxID=396811 RepID=L8JKU0_9BACT|nr:hypothetical protein C900_05841 [Fulvivirga imtechensis AK7]